MTKFLTLDIETHDEFIGLKMGSGWIYKLKNDSTKYEVIGVAVITHDGFKNYITDFSLLRPLIEKHDVIIGHNLQYDLGGLMTLGLSDVIKDKPIIDTYVMSKLFDSSLMNYDLDFLGNKYLNKSKSNQKLVDAVIKADIYPWLKKEIKEKDKAEKNGETYTRSFNEKTTKKVLKWCKSNMRMIQTHCYDVMSEYAIQDTVVTKELFRYFQHGELYEDIMPLAYKYSFVVHITMAYRIRGVRVDLNAARRAIIDIEPIVIDMFNQVYEIAGQEFNIRSSLDMAKVFEILGIAFKVTAKDNPSFTSDWMKSQAHPICQLITKIRSYKLIVDTFIKKIIHMQQEILGLSAEEVDKLEYGMVYPQLHVLRAKTGRFSSTDPNIQQIPKRDKVLGPICRSMFVPFPDEKWYSADYSNQEGRIHLHFAHLLNCPGTEDYLNEFLKNPKFDTHARVAELCEIERDAAKTIYLGKSYGMGGASTCKKLGLPTVLWTPKDSDTPIEVAGDTGKQIISKFNEMIPYLKDLSDKCTESLKSKKYIKTICGRKLRPEVVLEQGKFKSLYYRAMSLLSQGSAVDQLIEAMTLAYISGVNITCVVHDEMNWSSGDETTSLIVKECMESAVKLVLPQYIDVGVGDSWADAK